jgi:uncharacterized protein
MQNLIEFLLTHLVAYPAELSVEETDAGYRKLYVVTAHEDDIGQIIGQNGRTIKAVKKVAEILANALGERFEIKIKS